MRTVNITDYTILNPKLARVVVSYTGQVDRDYLHTELRRKLQGSATPVVGSFKEIKPGAAVGYIRANIDVRAVSEKQITAGYKAMGSNVLLDKEDKSLWELKTGAAGKYLVRQAQEDLSALVQAAAQRRSDVPRLSQISIAAAAKNELVAFVDQDGDMDYGFVTATGPKIKVVSFARRMETQVDYANVVSIQSVQIPRETHKQVLASMTPAEKTNAKAYWEKLYYWAPEYLQDLKNYVDQGTVC